MATETQVHSDLALPPGEYLTEVLDDCGLSQAELARRMGRPAQMVTEIVKGEKAITPETALQLEQVVRVPAHIWTGLEAEYQLVRARQEEEATVKEEAQLAERFPYASLAKLGVVIKTPKRVQKVRELRKFFGVASLHNLEDVHAFAPAFRQATGATASPEAVAAWLRVGALRAREITTEPYDARGLRAALPELRVLTREQPAVFQLRVKEVLASHGVAFVLLPHLPKTYVHGATFWITSTKAVLMMTIRGKWADIFWFSLFHELGHIMLHGKRDTFIEDSDPNADRVEEEADRFARDTLIPPREYQCFIEQERFDTASIQWFGDHIQIAPGIVTGRLQYDGHLAFNQHVCRERYHWVEE